MKNIIFDESYYNGGGDIGGYTNYNESSYYQEEPLQTANKFVEKALAGGVDIVGKKVLVLGCAYGYSVKYLISLGVDAYGMDISSYAISQSEIPDRLIVGDARVEASFITAKELAGLTKHNDKFDLIIDEDMLCCLTDADAVMFRSLGMDYSKMFIHMIDTSPHLIQWYNWKSVSDWKTLLGTSPKEKWYSRMDWSEG